jgi:hypothetical protein
MCPQVRTATAERSLFAYIFWVLQGDFSFKTFEQKPHVLKSTGEAENQLVDLTILS